MEITQEQAKKVLEVVDVGLCKGVGFRKPGQMCVEAAVCYAFGEPHGDKPTCVSNVLRNFKIALNDKYWSNNEARAKGLRRIAIAQLGTADTLDERLFIKKVAELTIRKTIPQAIELVAQNAPEPHKTSIQNAANKCREEGTEQAAREANKIVNEYRQYAAYAAAYAADAADAAAYAAYAADAAAYAADAAAYAAARDKVLSEYAEDVVQILIEMKTPGSKFLFLTEV